MENVNTIVEMVMDSLTTKNEAGEVTSFDFEGLKEVIKNLQANKKELSEVAKVQAKEQKKVADEENAEIGKAYVETLGEGDEISYTKADGTVITGTLVKYSDKTVTVRLPEDSPLLKGKDTSRKNYDCRYVKFEKIVVPAEVKAEMVA